MGILEESIGILRDNYSPLAGIPEAQLLRLIRTYELDSGDSVTFNSEQEDCVFVLSGEVTQDNGGEETILDPHNTLSRPVCLASGRITFSARQHSVLGKQAGHAAYFASHQAVFAEVILRMLLVGHVRR